PMPPPRPAAQSEDRARAVAALEDKSERAAAAVEGRYVVQVGAFAESAKAREARQRVEKLGLKTYTQVVETPAGSRIRVRVGPFGTREEADRAAGKLRSAGLPAALLTL
ncbi:MAG TPA: SPOR domain-containing protein, partial [Ideonella sp.]|nr:SPOR domain-containing protein [Ideonella sp.]